MVPQYSTVKATYGLCGHLMKHTMHVLISLFMAGAGGFHFCGPFRPKKGIATAPKEYCDRGMTLPSRFKLECHIIGAILSNVIYLPLNHKAGQLLLSKHGNVEQITLKVSQDFQKARPTECQ